MDKKQISKWQNWPKKPHKYCTKIKPAVIGSGGGNMVHYTQIKWKIDLFLTFSNVTLYLWWLQNAPKWPCQRDLFFKHTLVKSHGTHERLLKAAAAAKYSPSEDDFTALTSLPALKCASQIAPYSLTSDFHSTDRQPIILNVDFSLKIQRRWTIYNSAVQQENVLLAQYWVTYMLFLLFFC